MIIYKVTNQINQKVYIGKTKNSLKLRKKQHFEQLNLTKRKTIFQKALLKYGPENFIWEIIDTAKTLEELNSKEIHWIRELRSHSDFGNYNMTFGGDGGDILSELSKKGLYEPWNKGLPKDQQPNFGKKFSDETRKRIGEKSKGRICSEEKRQKLSIKAKGRKLNISGEVKRQKSEKLKVAHTGKKLTEEHKKKISEANKGRKMQYPSKFKGIPRTKEVKEKISLANKGKTLSLERRQQMSEIMKGNVGRLMDTKTCLICGKECRLCHYKKHVEKCKIK